MKIFILACLIVVALAVDHGHHGHHHDSGHHPWGYTGCNQDASKCELGDGCPAGQAGQCVNDVCYCSGPIVRRALHPPCTGLRDCSKMDCQHVHGPMHAPGGYCLHGHCTCHRALSCKTDTDCICIGHRANGTSTCHHFPNGHGKCTGCGHLH